MILRETDQRIFDMLQNISGNVINMIITNARNDY